MFKFISFFFIICILSAGCDREVGKTLYGDKKSKHYYEQQNVRAPLLSERYSITVNITTTSLFKDDEYKLCQKSEVFEVHLSSSDKKKEIFLYSCKDLNVNYQMFLISNKGLVSFEARLNDGTVINLSTPFKNKETNYFHADEKFPLLFMESLGKVLIETPSGLSVLEIHPQLKKIRNSKQSECLIYADKSLQREKLKKDLNKYGYQFANHPEDTSKILYQRESCIPGEALSSCTEPLVVLLDLKDSRVKNYPLRGGVFELENCKG